MFDDKSKSVGERKRINVHDDYELRFWSKKFGVAPNELRCAISMPVGTSWCGFFDVVASD
jgi:Protein of unknown function (DUF3606)